MKSGESRVLKHIELLRLMAGLKYKSHYLGVCNGYAYMAAQAHLVGETEVFIERLRKIARSVDEMARILNYQGKAKESQGALRHIGEELKIDYENKLRAFSYRNRKAQEMDSLQNEIADYVDMFAFMDGVELYLQTFEYPHLFEAGKAPAKGEQTLQAAILASSLVAPQVLTEENSMTGLDSFSGIYDVHDLEKYFELLKQSLDHATATNMIPRMALILSSSDHTITVGLDHEKKQWFFADANNKPQYYPLDQCAEIAKAVHSAFSEPNTHGYSVAFHTNCLAEQNACDLLRPILNDWNEYRVASINRVSKEKVRLKDVHTGATWLDTALLNNDCNVALQCLLILEKPVTFSRHLRKEELLELKKGVAALILNEKDLGKKAWMLKLALDENTALGAFFFKRRGLFKPSIKREGNIVYELNLAYEGLQQEYKIENEAGITSLRKSSLFTDPHKKETRHGKMNQGNKIIKGK